MSASGFGSLDELARRPDSPVLILQHPSDVDGSDDLTAARALYGGFVILSLSGTTANVAALRDRDVVLWPHQTAGNRQDCRELIGHLSRTAMRLRLVHPDSPMDWVGPSALRGRLNGHGSPIDWARDNCIEVPKLVDPEPPPPDHRERPPLVSDYSHPDIIPTEPEPVNLFEKRALPPLRREHVPPAIADYVFDQAEIIGCDPAYILVACLVTCATATHDSFKLQALRHNHQWTESARLWGALVGDPASKKTPAINAAMSHLKKLNLAMMEASSADMEVYRRELKLHEKIEATHLRQAAQGRSSGHPGPPPAKPPSRCLIAQDATPEALGVVLKDNPGGVMLLRDELSGWFGSMDAYGGGKGGKDAAFWLEAYNGGPMAVHRITRENLLIPNLSVNLIGGIQPSAMANIADKLPDDGLLQRFMVVIAQPVDGDGVDRAPNAQAVQGWRQILDWLVGCRPRTSDALVMSDGALKIRNALAAQLETLRKAYSHLPRLASHLGKWPALFVRLCLTYHAIACASAATPIDGQVSEDTARQVARLMVDFLFDHTRFFHEETLGNDWSTEHVRWIAGFILSRGAPDITLRTIYRASKRFAALPENRKRDVIRCLELAGWLIPVRQTHSGIPCAYWEVNPRVHELFAEHAGPELDRRLSARELIATKAKADKPAREAARAGKSLYETE